MKVFLLFIVLWLTAQLPLLAQRTAWEEQDDYVNGYARVFHQGNFSFINNNKKLISSFVFEGARNFYHHLAATQKNDKWGFINEQAQTIVPFEYDIVYNFSENVTVVSKSNKWWLINTQGHLIKQLDITLCYGFKNGTAIVYKNDQKGKLYTNGNIVFDAPVIKKIPKLIPYTPMPDTGASVCPPNIDFEYGNFTNWNCFIGNVDTVFTGGSWTNVITLTPSAPIPNRHTIYAKVTPSAVDPFGLFPTNPPDGSTYAVRLGNTKVHDSAERIQYIIHVPQNDSNFSFRYHYAVVLQNPGHTTWSQPRMQAKIFDSAANAYITCASFEFVSSSGLPGFAVSTVDTTVIYKPWAAVYINLRGYAGKTLYLEFTTADCARGAHWGYGYVDVEDMCGQAIQMNYQCDSPHVTTLTGPPGFQYYNWWNNNFTQIIDTGQTITLNPGPPPNTRLWLQVIPYANYGCEDTIPVILTGTLNAHFDASDTLGICAPHTFTFYNRNLPSTSTLWNFGDGTTGTGDTVTHTFNNIGTYIVTLNVSTGSGCNGVAKDTVHVIQPTGSFVYTGGNFCNSQTVQFIATTSHIDTLYWTFGDGTFLNTTQTVVSHTYNQPGIYVPQVVMKSIHGCQITLPGPDTIRIEKLIPGYTNIIQKFCGYTTVSFTDTSKSFFGIASHVWNFGDGTIATGNTVSHTYTTTGTYTIKLAITGMLACNDSISKNIFIKVNNFPVANVTGDSAKCAQSSLSFSSTIASTDTVNTLKWTSTNGASGTGNTFTTTFNNPGLYDVKFIAATVDGCYDTIIHPVNIQPLPLVNAGPGAELCLGSSVQLNATGAAQYNWSPSTGLSCTNCANPMANPTDTTNYIIQGTSSFGCKANDTLQVKVYKPFSMFHTANDTLCTGNSVTLNATGANNYLWSPSTGLNRTDVASPIASPTSSITYRVVGYDGHNCFSDTAFINVLVAPVPTVNAGPDLTLATGDVVTLNAVAQNGPIIKWLWQPATDLSCSDCPSTILKVHGNTTYSVTVTNNYNCIARAVVNIFTFCKEAQVFIPNAFTPDGDGLNDVLMVRGKGIHVNYFRIFNRWGELIFEKKDFMPNDPQYGWDGKIRGIPAPPDVFVYIAEVICDNNVRYTVHGNTTLLK